MMPIRGIKLTGKQPAALELPRRVHSTHTRLHYNYIGINELEKKVYSGSRIYQTPQVRQLFIRQYGLFQFGTPTTGLREKLGKPTARLN